MKSARYWEAALLLLARLPATAGRAIAWTFAHILFIICGSSRRRVMAEIQSHFPELSWQSRARMTVGYVNHILVSVFELVKMSKEPALNHEAVVIENPERLSEVGADATGTVVLTAHFGNPTVLCSWSAIFGRPVAYLVRPERLNLHPLRRAVRAIFQRLAESLGWLRIESSARGGIAAVRHLRRGNVLIVLSDLTWGSGIQTVKFFGSNYPVSRSAVRFAALASCAILPLIVWRERANHHRLIVLPRIRVPESAGRPDDSSIMQEFTSQLEAEIRKRPEQWAWIHESSSRSYQGLVHG